MWFTLILFVLVILYFLKENSKGEEKQSSAQDILTGNAFFLDID